MTEDDRETDGKMEEWMYDFAWKVRDDTLDGIKIIDNKAMSIINFSSILIPIITAILYYISSIRIYSEITQLFLIISIILLLLSIILAFRVLMPKNHGIIRIQNHFKKMDDVIDKMKEDGDKYLEILGSTGQEIAEWQNVLIITKKNKVKDFKRSSYIFVGALVFVFLSTMGISYPWIKQILTVFTGS